MTIAFYEIELREDGAVAAVYKCKKVLKMDANVKN